MPRWSLAHFSAGLFRVSIAKDIIAADKWPVPEVLYYHDGIATTRAFIRDLFANVRKGVAQGHDLKRVFADTDAMLRPTYGGQFIYEHCMPFDVSRAYDEATAHRDPRIWTAERDQAMWASLA